MYVCGNFPTCIINTYVINWNNSHIFLFNKHIFSYIFFNELHFYTFLYLFILYFIFLFHFFWLMACVKIFSLYFPVCIWNYTYTLTIYKHGCDAILKHNNNLSERRRKLNWIEIGVYESAVKEIKAPLNAFNQNREGETWMKREFLWIKDSSRLRL